MSYLKEIDEPTAQKFAKDLKKGLNIFKNLGDHPNIKKMDKYLIKLGDLNSEHNAEDFPFVLEKETHFICIDTKHNTAHMTVEIEGAKDYHITYTTKAFTFEIAIAYDEEKKAASASARMPKVLIEHFKKCNIAKEKIVDDAFNLLGKMISIAVNPGCHYSFEWPEEFNQKTSIGFRNIGKLTLLTTKHKNTLHICDAYPLFFEVNWKKFAIEELRREKQKRESGL